MKKKYIAFLIAATTALFASAQNETKAKEVKQDFVTPDHPAFKILEIDPSNILRPSNIKEFSTITGDYFKPPAYVIPRSFSAEISPALLAQSNKLTLDGYKRNWMGYGCRISIATQAVDDKWQKRELGIGYRMTFIDKGDFRRDAAFLEELRKPIHRAGLTRNEFENNAERIVLAETEFKKLYEAYQKDSTAASNNPTDQSLQNAQNTSGDKLQKYRDKRIGELFEEYQKDPNKYKTIDEEINALRQKFKDDNWNADRLDAGFAFKLITPDTVFSKNMRYNKFSFWLAGSKKVNGKAGKAQQQLLFGANFNTEYKQLDTRDTTWLVYTTDSTGVVVDSQSTLSKISNDSISQNNFSYSFSARYYLGTNRVKGFAELQIGGNHTIGHKHLSFEEGRTNTEDFKIHSFKLLLNAGIEANITDGVWLLANAGYKFSYDSDSRGTTSVTSGFVYQLNFRFNIPEKFKLF